MLKNFFLFICLIAGPAFSADYWISFTTGEHIFVMKINDSGDVLVEPTIVDKTLVAFNTSMTPAGTNFAVWAVITGESGVYGPVKRLLVDKTTLNSSTITNFDIQAFRKKDGAILSSSQNPNNLFLAFNKKTTLKGYGLNVNQKYNGQSFRISPRTDGNFLNGGVASDGLMSWSIAPEFVAEKLYLQALRSTGAALGDPFVAGTAPDGEHLSYADISNPVPDGKRFAAYVSTVDSFPYKNSIYVQVVDADTGKKIGTRKLIASGFETKSSVDGSIAMDPEGHFVLYTYNDPACPTNTILFQPLDSSGSASVTPFEIVECNFDPPSHTGASGIDIMKE